ncbi:amino acid ABC transporter substrate-binding protein [Nodosilinea sp. LEGE 06152]|uniref:substrate-binding periplasmic protein n=1 Tax=Nodosilinea sp. LEGE 06152 TaxID=2777966 RepID=UPI00187EE9CB|nr:ABC transporter substrate-binding protein [Nodosilinea sp. LEGE 06152]MBE9157227.1 amino acid ABC transporter substrate-binding protein [Nodosilinea sp. LEGE 06152]
MCQKTTIHNVSAAEKKVETKRARADQWIGVQLLGLALTLFLVITLGCSDGAQAAAKGAAVGAATATASTASAGSTLSRSPSSSSGSAVPAMPPDVQRVLDKGKLTVAVLGQDNAPFFMDEAGQMSGLDIQLARTLADQLGVSLEITRTAQTFDQVVDMVYGQKADLAISKISRTLKRAQRVRFSRPYLRMRQGLLVNRLQMAEQTQGRSMVATIRDLQGQVGVIKGSSYVGFLKQKFPQASIVEYPTWEDIVEAVVQGDILAAYRDELEIKKVVRTRPDVALQLQTIALTDTQDSLAVVLPWSSSHLLAFVDQYLDTLTAQYTVDAVLDEYADYWVTQRLQQP